MIDQPTAEDPLKKLETLLGEWALAATSPDGEPWPGEARASFQWHESLAHLIARTTVDVPARPTPSRSSAATRTYYQLYSDDRGVCRVYEMNIGDGEWTLWRTGEPFPQRFTGRFEDNGNTIVGRWEKAENGEHYETDFDLTYRKVT